MPPPSSRACEAGFVFALETEADPFAALVEETTDVSGALRFHEGLLRGRRVAWVVGGAGPAAAARAAGLLIDGHAPRRIVSAGFAGGLDPNLRRGDLAVAARSLRPGHAEHVLVPPALAGTTAVGAIVTVERVVTTAAAKRAIRDACGAALVDMETHAVAGAASAAGLPCISVRVVSDAADDELPDDLAALVAPQSALRRAGAALAALGRRPAAAKAMWRLWENAVVDGRTLAESLACLAESWPGETAPEA